MAFDAEVAFEEAYHRWIFQVGGDLETYFVPALAAAHAAGRREGWGAACAAVLKGLASENDTVQRRAIEASVLALAAQGPSE